MLTKISRPIEVSTLDFVPYAGVRWHAQGIYLRDQVKASTVKAKTLTKIHSGDIVYNRMWATKASFGLAGDDVDGCLVTNDFPVFETDPDHALAAYVGLLFHDRGFQAQAAARATGTTDRRRLKEPDFLDIDVYLPPLPAQRRIVDLIDALDEAIEGSEVATARSLYNEVLTRTMNGAKQAPLSSAMHQSRDSVSVNDRDSYRIIGVLRSGEGFIDRGLVQGESMAYSRLSSVKPDQLVYRKLTAWEGPISVAAESETGAFVSSEFPVFDIDSTVLLPGLLRHMCRWSGLWKRMEGRLVGSVLRRKRLNPDQLLEVNVAMPSLPEQQVALDLLDATWEAQIESAGYVDSLRTLRQNLLAALLSGEHEIPSSYDEHLGVVA